jgi:hypothetical protein
MQHLVTQIALFFTLLLLPLLGVESARDSSIIVISRPNTEVEKTTENSDNVEILYGTKKSAQKVFRMLINPSKYFKTYKCESIIVVHNGPKIKERLNGPIAKVLESCDSELNLFFVRNGKTNLGHVLLDVSDLKGFKQTK